uniref:Gustatory receptor n=1 Tax=Protaetia brevitarsis TaxID=348688 RepID=A0A411HR97_PROBE|nr:gustatory receptor [Protaetia brevitarsis]
MKFCWKSKQKDSTESFSYWKTIMQSLEEPANVYDTLIPVHVLMKSVGLSPCILVVENGKLRYRSSTLGSIYSVLAILLFVGYYIYAVEERETNDETNKVVRSIDMYHLYGSMIVMACCIILNSVHQKTLIEAIDRLNDADVIMAGYTKKIDWKTSRNNMTVYLLVIMAMLAAGEFMNCTMFLRQVATLNTYCLLMCYIPMLINGFVEAQFVCHILLLKQRFAVLNSELRRLITKQRPLPSFKIIKVGPPIVEEEPKTLVPSKLIHNARQLHCQLCEIGVLLNRYYSKQILLDIGDVFIGFTTLAYYCFDGCMKLYMKDDESNLYNTVTTGVWTLVKLSRLLVLTLSCSIVKNEAKSSGDIIYKIENKYQPELSPEVYAFGKQIIHWNFKFTAFDFFEVDMSLFYSAVSSATTYLMILLQLDIANKQIEKSMENSENHSH